MLHVAQLLIIFPEKKEQFTINRTVYIKQNSSH